MFAWIASKKNPRDKSTEAQQIVDTRKTIREWFEYLESAAFDPEIPFNISCACIDDSIVLFKKYMHDCEWDFFKTNLPLLINMREKLETFETINLSHLQALTKKTDKRRST